MILTYHIAYIAVITILLAIIVWQNIDKLHAVKAFGKTKIIPIVLCITLLLLVVAGIVSYKNNQKRIEDEKKRLANKIVILSATKMIGMDRASYDEACKELEIEKLKSSWNVLASKTRRLLPKTPDINMLNRMDEEWSKYR